MVITASHEFPQTIRKNLYEELIVFYNIYSNSFQSLVPAHAVHGGRDLLKGGDVKVFRKNDERR